MVFVSMKTDSEFVRGIARRKVVEYSFSLSEPVKIRGQMYGAVLLKRNSVMSIDYFVFPVPVVSQCCGLLFIFKYCSSFIMSSSYLVHDFWIPILKSISLTRHSIGFLCHSIET